MSEERSVGRKPRPLGRPSNLAEGEFWDAATAAGWRPMKRGWPDFFMVRGDEIALVEVKPHKGRRLKREQREIMERLAAFGVPCYRWSPDGGMEPISNKGVGVGDPSDSSIENYQPQLQDEGFGEKDEPGSGKLAQGSRRGWADRVWAHYVEVMQPRHRELPDEERRIILKALEVASVEECCHAIDGCRASDFHMGNNERNRKYNRISQILRGRQGKETTRERIEFFMDLAGSSTGGVRIPSVLRATVAARQLDVQRGHRMPGSPQAVEAAEEAEAWLRQHGIETVRDGDAEPSFRPVEQGVSA